MRLICGFLHLDGRPAEAARLEAMMAAQIGPGLDPCRASHVEGPVALGMLDFALPGGRGSLPRGASGLVAAADLRLGPTGSADQRALLDGVERGGPDGLSSLAGDFAVAAWSQRDHSLLLGRDALGVRPLFLSILPGCLVFASLPAGLFASCLVERELDEAFLLGEAILAFHGPERSIFRGVERLQPGGWLRAGSGAIERGRHWTLDPALEGTRHLPPEAAAEEAAALVADAVRRCLPPAGPMAAHLSGGLDSAALAILAAREQRAGGRPMLCYSLVPSDRFRSFLAGELPGIEPVLRQEPGIDWTPIAIEDPARFILPDMDSDQPMPIDPRDAEVRICRDAARRGAAVLLSGWGGDEGLSFNGRGALARDISPGRWPQLCRTAWDFHAHGVEAKTLLGEAALTLFGGQLAPLIERMRGRVPRRSLQAEILPCVKREALMAAGLGGATPRPRSRHGLLTGPGLPRRTEHWSITAAHQGLAVAFPLLDRPIVEFAFSLTGSLFLGNPRRCLFRDAMAGILPPEIRQRREKLDTIPEAPLLLAARRNTLGHRLAEWRSHPRISALFDLDEIARRISRLPAVEGREAEFARSGDLQREAGALRRLFLMLEFIVQHH